MDHDIRRIGPGDVAGMRAINALFAVAFEDQANYADAPPPDAHLQDLLDNPGFIPIAAFDGDRMIGALVAYELVKFEQARREIYIYDLAVAEPARRRGVATALIGHVQSIAREIGAYVVFVQADYDDPPAIALYESLGIREEVLHFDIPPAAT